MTHQTPIRIGNASPLPNNECPHLWTAIFFLTDKRGSKAKVKKDWNLQSYSHQKSTTVLQKMIKAKTTFFSITNNN